MEFNIQVYSIAFLIIYIHSIVNIKAQELCKTKLSPEDLIKFKQAIYDDYFFEMLVGILINLILFHQYIRL